MEIVYKYAESTVKPLALEVTKSVVYLRKDFSTNTRQTEQGEETTYWTYLEAELSPEEFNAYSNYLVAENAIKGTNDSENIVSLMVGQEIGDDNQLAIMEAIADLYEMIAMLG